MLPVSQNWKTYYNKSSVFSVNITAILASGESLSFTDADIMLGTLEIRDEIMGATGLSVGSVISQQFNCVLVNENSMYSNYNFLDAQLFVWLHVPELATDNIFKGIFYVTSVEYNGRNIKIEAFDEMAADKEKNSASISGMDFSGLTCREAIAKLGYWGPESFSRYFPNQDYVLPAISATEGSLGTDITPRDMLGYIAEICGCYAKFYPDSGLQLKAYPLYNYSSAIDGGLLNYSVYSTVLYNTQELFEVYDVPDSSLDGGEFAAQTGANLLPIPYIYMHELITDFYPVEYEHIEPLGGSASATTSSEGNEEAENSERYREVYYSPSPNGAVNLSFSWYPPDAEFDPGDFFDDWEVSLTESLSLEAGDYILSAGGRNIAIGVMSGNAKGAVLAKATPDNPKAAFTITDETVTLYVELFFSMEDPQWYSGSPFSYTAFPMINKASEQVPFWTPYTDNRTWTPGDNADGGLFTFWTPRTGVPIIEEFDTATVYKIMSPPIIANDRVVITGVQVSGSSTNTVLAGSNEKLIEINNNPIIINDTVAQEVAENVYQVVGGLNYLPFDLSLSADPRFEAGDAISFDYFGETISTICTQFRYNLGGFSSMGADE